MGPSKPRANLGGFSGGPRRDVRRAARRDLQDDQRHDPRALVHHVFVLSRCLPFSLVRFFFVTSSSVRFLFASKGRISFWPPEVGLGIPKPTSGHRKRRATRGRIGIHKPTSGHLRLVRTSRSRCGCGGAQVFECVGGSMPRIERRRLTLDGCDDRRRDRVQRERPEAERYFSNPTFGQQKSNPAFGRKKKI